MEMFFAIQINCKKKKKKLIFLMETQYFKNYY